MTRRVKFQRFPFSIVSSRQLDYTFYPGVGYLTSPGVDISYKGALAYSVSSERHRQCGVNELAQVSKSRQRDSNRGPSDRQSCIPTTEQSHPMKSSF